MSGGRYVQVDLSELTELANDLHMASTDLKRELALFLDAAGVDMLRVIQDEIIRLQVVDTRLLLSSFTKGDVNNIYRLSSGDLTLEIGTNVEYAAYVNDGHWLNPQGVNKRFVPGHWSNDRFIYERGANTGMVLKQKYISGKHYMEHAVNIMEQLFPEYVERRLDDWLSRYFSD